MTVPAPNVALEEPPLPTRERVRDALARHFLLRLDMIVILSGTFAAGLAATRLLLFLHVNHLGIRYGLAITIAFGAFLLFVRVWLAYVAFRAGSAKRSHDSGDNWADAINFTSNGLSIPDFSGGDSGGSDSGSFGGGGGKFGGGGASGSWGEPSNQPVIALPLRTGSVKSGSGGGGKGGGRGFDFGGDDDLMLIVLAIAFILAIAAAVCYLVYAAPVVLSEAAFNAALTGALTRHAKNASGHEWIGVVVKKTILPFVAVLAMGMVLGFYAHSQCPSAVRLVEAFHCVGH